ncbi:hypothetical protein P7C73_g4598, partial [Tremellales sp. Uapishka_1]
LSTPHYSTPHYLPTTCSPAPRDTPATWPASRSYGAPAPPPFYPHHSNPGLASPSAPGWRREEIQAWEQSRWTATPTQHYQYPQPSYWSNEPQYGTDDKKARASPKPRKHVCPVCDKRFNRPSSLSTHMSVHTGARPFQCRHQDCGRKFSVSSNLRRHQRTHENKTVRERVATETSSRQEQFVFHPTPGASFPSFPGYFTSPDPYPYPQQAYEYAPTSSLSQYHLNERPRKPMIFTPSTPLPTLQPPAQIEGKAQSLMLPQE